MKRPNLAIKGSSSKVFAKFSKSSSESASEVSEYSASIERIQDSILMIILLYELIVVFSHNLPIVAFKSRQEINIFKNSVSSIKFL